MFDTRSPGNYRRVILALCIKNQLCIPYKVLGKNLKRSFFHISIILPWKHNDHSITMGAIRNRNATHANWVVMNIRSICQYLGQKELYGAYVFQYVNWFNYNSIDKFRPSHFDSHDDVIKWKHFPRYWRFVRGIHRSPGNSPHKGQWRGALMSSLIFDWINSWENNREAGDLRRHRAHYDVIVMWHGGNRTPVPVLVMQPRRLWIN